MPKLKSRFNLGMVNALRQGAVGVQGLFKLEKWRCASKRKGVRRYVAAIRKNRFEGGISPCHVRV